ncbi:CLAVATA3/ESR-RELATED 16 [Hibiscus trionum]|uniref:CLAVATA3/ESR-RELATED 16 n=1 Tax=Hibiscus trionum TaxID=183268 RepID=A0A9W7I312_HIBTR|nr:CLAVATA3/ESR-RELATED 16 [Hibiscus trionum]
MRGFRGCRYSNGGCRAALFFFWIILILSQLGLHSAVHENQQSFMSPPRKARFNSDSNAHFHGPPSSSSPQFTGNEDDKRIVHTGPNPLHNK